MRISKPIGAFAASVLMIGSLAVGAQAAGASPHTLYVGLSHCSATGPGTAKVPYCTISEAVNAATPGMVIQIAAGTYSEQVVISGTGKNNLTLDGDNWNDTVISAPAVLTAPTKSIVEVSTATGVTIENLKITGPGSGGCDSLEYGVRVDTFGQANILNDRIANIADSPLSGCQNGIGILVGRQLLNTSGSAVINGDIITGYQKGGIVVSNTGSDATILDNTVTGIGPTTVIAQNGIQISAGATARLANNVVKGNVYTGTQNAASAGILLYSPGVVKLNGNIANSNDVDIWAISVTNSAFTTNVANKGTYNGIYVDPDSTGNTFRNNSAHGTTGSGNYDLQDDSRDAGTAGTANTWQGNDCGTAEPLGICVH